ncbi:type VI secretion system contractile sheath large subunit [Thiohalorhabdus methylotrophus]|uniref:Type VI secretion system contractile sheath large subunit n=1 Tax=Thiohalorhabdus methylotrophus TaxID=3242694 RepID=A0ABV4TSP5_9GAMM
MADLFLQQTPWDPLALTFQSLREGGSGRELPFRLLVLGDFGDRRTPAGEREPVAVNPANFEEVLRARGIRLQLTVENCLGGTGEETEALEVPIDGAAGFTPRGLLEGVPQLRAAWEVLAGLAGEDGPATEGEEARKTALREEVLRAAGGDRRVAFAELSGRLERQLDRILHHPEFRTLEANWLGVHFLLGHIHPESNAQVVLLDMDRETLHEDFRGQPELAESVLFDRMYVRELGQYGGVPFGALITTYAFGPGSEDAGLLRSLARVGAACQCPVIGQAGCAVLGAVEAAEVAEIPDLREAHAGAVGRAWRDLAASPEARFLGLGFPEIVLRGRYDYLRDDIPLVAYREGRATADHGPLTGSAAFAFGANLLESFERYRLCSDIAGEPGGAVRGLAPGRDLDWMDTGMATPVQISETRERDLAELGFIPLSASREVPGQVVVHAAPSLAWGARRGRAPGAEGEGMDEQVAAQLPYQFLVCRVGHFLKVIQRDNLGTLKSPVEVQSELNSWLSGYVSDVENPSEGVRARRPFREARVEVADGAGADGRFDMTLRLVPHLKYLSSRFALTLHSSLGPR